MAVSARRDRAGDDSLAFVVSRHRGAELLNHADGFVADGEALPDRILALEDVHVRAADRRGRDANECVGRSDTRQRLFTQHDAPGASNTAAFMVAIVSPRTLSCGSL